jgi:hypothetical protein
MMVQSALKAPACAAAAQPWPAPRHSQNPSAWTAGFRSAIAAGLAAQTGEGVGGDLDCFSLAEVDGLPRATRRGYRPVALRADYMHHAKLGGGFDGPSSVQRRSSCRGATRWRGVRARAACFEAARPGSRIAYPYSRALAKEDFPEEGTKCTKFSALTKARDRSYV